MTTTTRQSLSPAQRRALESVTDEGSINAAPVTFRWLKDHGMVSVDMRNGHVTVTDAGHAARGTTTPPAASVEPAGREARTWDATTAETHTCAGACGRTLPAKSFPTTGKPGRRGVVCRADRDAARSAV